MNDSSRELEREASRSRRRLSGLLDELRDRASPGEMVEQLVQLADRDGGGSEFIRNLKQQVRRHPLPCLLIATGITWLMISDLQKTRQASADGLRASPGPAARSRRPPAKKSKAPVGSRKRAPRRRA